MHARPGLPALVLRLKSDVTFAASASFSEFARSVLTQAVSRDLDDAEVAAHVAAAAAAGGVATSANDVADVAQRLRRFGCGLAQETRPATPILKRIRCGALWLSALLALLSSAWILRMEATKQGAAGRRAYGIATAARS